MTEGINGKKRNGRMRGVVERLGKLWRRILHQKKHTPEEIAGGMAIGLFMAFASPPGLQLLPAAALASITGCSVIAAVSAVFVSNPFTMPFLYPLAGVIGSWITGVPLRGTVPTTDEGFWKSMTDFRSHGRTVSLVMVGCIIMGTLAALIGYHVTKVCVNAHRRHLAATRGSKSHDESDPDNA